MGNPQRGEVALTVGDRSYRLVIDLDAICQLEESLSTPEHLVTISDVLVAMLRLSHRHIRAFVWAALRRHHSDVTLAQAGALIEDAGGVEKLFEQLEKLKQTTQPDAEDRATRPRAARQPGGTGEPATSTPGGSASRRKRSGG